MNYMDQYEDREDPRYHGFFNIYISVAEIDKSLEAWVEDVSITGLRLSCDYPINALKVDAEVSFCVDNAFGLGSFNFEGKVVHSYDQANLAVYGIKIIDMDPKATYQWGRIVAHVRRKHRKV